MNVCKYQIWIREFDKNIPFLWKSYADKETAYRRMKSINTLVHAYAYIYDLSNGSTIIEGLDPGFPELTGA